MYGGSCGRHPVCLSLGPPPHAWSGRYVGQGTVNKQFALTEVADNRAAIHRASHHHQRRQRTTSTFSLERYRAPGSGESGCGEEGEL